MVIVTPRSKRVRAQKTLGAGLLGMLAACLVALAVACRGNDEATKESEALDQRLRQGLRRFLGELGAVGEAARASQSPWLGSCDVQICEALEQRSGRLPLATFDRLRWMANPSRKEILGDLDLRSLLNSPSVLALRPLDELRTVQEVTSAAFHAKRLQEEHGYVAVVVTKALILPKERKERFEAGELRGQMKVFSLSARSEAGPPRPLCQVAVYARSSLQVAARPEQPKAEALRANFRLQIRRSVESAVDALCRGLRPELG